LFRDNLNLEHDIILKDKVQMDEAFVKGAFIIGMKDIKSKRIKLGLTSEIEGIWANLRTFIRRMYHYVTLEKLPKIVAEFEARFSQKEIFDNPLAFLENSLSAMRLAL